MKSLKLLLVAMWLLVSAMSLGMKTHTPKDDETLEDESLSRLEAEIDQELNSADLWGDDDAGEAHHLTFRSPEPEHNRKRILSKKVRDKIKKKLKEIKKKIKAKLEKWGVL